MMMSNTANNHDRDANYDVSKPDSDVQGEHSMQADSSCREGQGLRLDLRQVRIEKLCKGMKLTTSNETGERDFPTFDIYCGPALDPSYLCSLNSFRIVSVDKSFNII